MPEAILVVPCYNEEHRFSWEAFAPLLKPANVSLLFVDDGSTDNTRSRLLEAKEHHPARIDVLFLDANRGKAEAVRAGLQHGVARGAEVIGYTDADLATPCDEILRLLDALYDSPASAVLGSRVAILGANIEREAVRHYLGRIFASAASLVLRTPVYDTQCGAKWFRRTEDLRRALEVPFRSRWGFDVELLGRLLIAGEANGETGPIVEVPLRRWTGVAGSRLRPAAMLKTGLELLAIERDLRRWRSGRR